MTAAMPSQGQRYLMRLLSGSFVMSPPRRQCRLIDGAWCVWGEVTTQKERSPGKVDAGAASFKWGFPTFAGRSRLSEGS